MIGQREVVAHFCTFEANCGGSKNEAKRKRKEAHAKARRRKEDK
jgi:hypothetical protein